LQTVVLVTVQALRTVDYKVDAKVLVAPQNDLTDERSDDLKTGISVRLFPWNTLGDQSFVALVTAMVMAVVSWYKQVE
jgi:hypothetical protein